MNKRKEKAVYIGRKIGVRDIYPASSIQQRIYAVQQLDDTGIAYNMPSSFLIDGDLDTKRLRLALRAIIKANSSLRTVVRTTASGLEQVILQNVEPALVIEDCRGNSLNEVLGGFVKPFLLEEECGIRVRVRRFENSKWVMQLDMHHMYADGDCYGWLVGDLICAYLGKKLKGESIRYVDYSAWEAKRKNSRKYVANEEYWRSQFGLAPAGLEWPIDRRRSSMRSFQGSSISFTLPPETTASLRLLARRSNTRLNLLLLAIWKVLVARVVGVNDLSVGLPLSERENRRCLRRVAGMFANVLPIRTFPRNELSFSRYLRDLRETVHNAKIHKEISLEALLAHLRVSDDNSRHPLFEIGFSYSKKECYMYREGEHLGASWNVSNATMSNLALPCTTSKLDLSMLVRRENNKIEFSIEYSTHLFDRAIIEDIGYRFLLLAEQVTTDSEILLSDLKMMGEAERCRLVTEWNRTESSLPRGILAHQLFEATVDRNPSAIAVRCGIDEVSYADLESRANMIAYRLVNTYNVSSDTLIGLYIDRSVEMIVGMLAILKAGAAYVPIDSNYPAERIRFIIEDCALHLMLAGSLLPLEIGYKGDVLVLSDVAMPAVSATRIPCSAGDSNLAYVMYTSGSTGRPKGVMIEHRSVVSLALACQEMLGLQEAQFVLQFASIGFDASVWEIFQAFAGGKTLVLRKGDSLLGERTINEVDGKPERGVITIPPSVLAILEEDDLLSGCTVVSAGEVCPLHLAQKWANRINLINAYGPTEGTVCATYYKVNGNESGRSVPIGRPIANTQVYVLDTMGRVVPCGVMGELYIGGIGVARGYINLPGLTAQRFIADGFGNKPGRRLYRTGDLVKWQLDGNLEFIGRTDDQVKIRGFRIELAEVENAMRKTTGVTNAAVNVWDDKNKGKHLCGFWTGDATCEFLREQISKSLPEYMVPSFLQRLDELPLNSSGKVSRNQLPKPFFESSQPKLPANDEIEAKLKALFEKVLGAARLGIDDDFFALGGHSITAVQLLTSIRTSFCVSVPVRAFFEASTVRKMSVLIRCAAFNPSIIVRRGKECADYPSTSQQKRLYAMQLAAPTDVAYNIPSAFRLKADVDPIQMRDAILAVMSAYSILRTVYCMKEGEVRQRIKEQFEIPFEVRKSELSTVKEEMVGFVKPYDLEIEHPIRCKLSQLGRFDWLLQIDIHHIAVDESCHNTIINGIFNAYLGNPPENESLRYADFALWQTEGAGAQEIADNNGYWLEQFKRELPVAEIPSDFRPDNSRRHKGLTHSFLLSEDLHTRLQELAQKEKATMYMVLLALWQVLLSKLTGVDDVCVGIAVSGRSREEFNQIVGMFVNTIALRSTLPMSMTFRQYLSNVRYLVLQGIEHQNFALEKLIEEIEWIRERGRKLPFETMFVQEEFRNTQVRDRDADSNIWSSNGIITEKISSDSISAKFPLTLYVKQRGKVTECRLEYSSELFTAQTAKKIGEQYTQLARQAAYNPEIPLRSLEIIDERERDRLLFAFNDNRKQYKLKATIQELFEESVDSHPNAIAIECRGRKLSYLQLDKKANRLANTLRNKYLVGPGRLVGISMGKSIELIVSILAILKTGGAYISLDPTYPLKRLEHIIADSKTELIVTKGRLPKELRFSGTMINVCKATPIGRVSSERIKIVIGNLGNAYVLYTSGSTGVPKGVGMPHSALVNLLEWHQNNLPMRKGTRTLQYASVNFDVSFQEILSTLIGGGILVLPGESARHSPIVLLSCLQKQKIERLFVPFVALEQLAQHANRKTLLLRRLKEIITAGEQLIITPDIKELFCRLKKVRLHNHYGPTETHVVTAYELPRDRKSWSTTPPIGKPISNVGIYLLNAQFRLVPIGTPGELYVGGPQIALGYLNRGSWTAERFIANAHGCIHGGRLYRTGDLARWMPDGNLEFLGRVDDQVKIRGFRIELGEIESSVRNVPGVKECAAFIHVTKNNDKQLCVYWIGSNTNEAKICAHMRLRMPLYMIPNHIIKIKSLPLTHTGKLDRKRLPNPDTFTKKIQVQTRNKHENDLALLYASALDRDIVDTKMDFISLGGHSLIAIKLTDLIFKRFKVRIKMSDLLTKTIKMIYNTVILPLQDRCVDESNEALKNEDIGVDSKQDAPRAGLSFQLNIPIRSYLDYAFPLSILAGRPGYLPYLYTYNIQTFFPDSILGRGKVGLNKFMMRPSLNNWQWSELGLLHIETERRYAADPITPELMLAEMEDWISDGYYLETRLNEYYLPCRPSAFKRVHNCHINMVVGIDKSSKQLLLAGYSDDYQIDSVDFGSFVRSFTRSSEMSVSSDLEGSKYHRVLWKWKTRTPNHRPIDCCLMRRQMEQYINGESSHELRIIAAFDKEAYPDESGTWGVKTYDSWDEYLCQCERGSSVIDLRASRTLWEHKMMMLDRIKYVRNMEGRIPFRLVGDCEEIEKRAKALRLMAFAYNREKRPHYIETMRKRIQDLRTAELRVWRELLEYI